MDLFRKVWSIYTIMKEEAIEGNRADFTGLVCQHRRRRQRRLRLRPRQRSN